LNVTQLDRVFASALILQLDGTFPENLSYLIEYAPLAEGTQRRNATMKPTYPRHLSITSGKSETSVHVSGTVALHRA
jgi:hypothetical protein